MSDGNYTLTERIFHQIALSGRSTPEMFFDIEANMFAKTAPDSRQGRHVFVSGLARAGTTILMRMLHDTDAFASLTYRDMPLVMAPNLWARFSSGKQKQGDRRERGHGDGLLVGFDSPEALEEVFWRTFCGRDYIKPDTLVPMRAGADEIEAFQRYVGLVMRRYDRPRYLSKNNNSILRLSSLTRAFPNAVILVPFRNPATQAASLLRQHRHFVDVHATDPFGRKYMSWLVHHEFGADHRRFDFGSATECSTDDAMQLDYWLELWIEAYTYLSAELEKLGDRTILVSYEDLTTTPDRIRDTLFSHLDLKPVRDLEIENRPQVETPDLKYLAEAKAIYAKLKERSDRQLAALA